jgi:hypothetical protein
MPNQHKYRPIPFRPPEGDRLWLAEYARRTGRAVNAIIAEAVAAYRAAREKDANPDLQGRLR